MQGNGLKLFTKRTWIFGVGKSIMQRAFVDGFYAELTIFGSRVSFVDSVQVTAAARPVDFVMKWEAVYDADGVPATYNEELFVSSDAALGPAALLVNYYMREQE